MLPNSITLAVDTANNGTTTNESFVRMEELVNRSTYRGPNHTLHARNQLQFYRTLPKRSGDFLGSAKVEAKFTMDVSVVDAKGDTAIVPAIISVAQSLPVGMTAAAKLALRQRLIALIDDDTVMGPHGEYQEI